MYPFRTVVFILLSGLLCCTQTFGQTAPDSAVKQAILLTPYIPDYYLSDADQDILQSSKQQPEEFRYSFRRSLDLRLSGELETHFKVVSLLQDTSKHANPTFSALGHLGDRLLFRRKVECLP